MEGQDKKEQGFTLIELLIAIVVVGILTAVAVVGIGGLIDNGATGACSASADAAKAATAVYYANESDYPDNFGVMRNATPVILDVPAGVVGNGTTLTKGTDWVLTMNDPGTAEITYTCS